MKREHVLFVLVASLLVVLTASCIVTTVPPAAEDTAAGAKEVEAAVAEQAASEEPAVSPGQAVVALTEDADLGPFLTDSGGLTLYLFTRDEPGVSNCYDQCAEAWPPLLTESGMAPVAEEGVSGELSVIERNDGSQQVAYNGMPLYYYRDDAKPGDTVGQGRGEVWFVVNPAPMVAVTENADLGPFLTDSEGLTLYLFTKDEPGVSNCYDQCAEAWPPLLFGAAGLTPAAGLSGTLGVTTRTDETQQVTYNGMPLYYYRDDAKPGDTVGQGRGEVWFVVNP